MTTPRLVERSDHRFKTKPLGPYQRKGFMASRDREIFALFYEQGTGKSWVDINATAWAFGQGLIDGWVIVAPNGVHRNWVARELPKHWPDDVPCRVILWEMGRAGTKGFARDLNELIAARGCAIFAMNIDAVITPRGKAALKRFLFARQCKLTIDESSKIKTPGAKRTKVLRAAGKHARQRRILTGTPVTRGPLDLYAQFAFLDPNALGFNSFYSFKHHFAEWGKGYNASTGTEFEELIGYKNLPELRRLVAPHSARVLKQDVLKDLPPKLYQVRDVPLSLPQRRVYDQLRDEYIVELEGGRVSAPMALVRLLRLQQVTCGYLPIEGETVSIEDKAVPSRVAGLLDLLEEADGKGIIWARFAEDLRQIEIALRKAYGAAAVVSYHGRVKTADRDRAIDTFQDLESPVRWFVAQQQAGGFGLTLTAATLNVYYSNTFSLEQRLQTEDRPHRQGQRNAVLNVDLIAPDTVDENIVEALRAGRNLAAEVNGDHLKAWLNRGS